MAKQKVKIKLLADLEHGGILFSKGDELNIDTDLAVAMTNCEPPIAEIIEEKQ
jgi:hypothetical protein